MHSQKKCVKSESMRDAGGQNKREFEQAELVGDWKVVPGIAAYH